MTFLCKEKRILKMGMKKNGQNQKDLNIYIYILREMSEGRLRSLGK